MCRPLCKLWGKPLLWIAPVTCWQTKRLISLLLIKIVQVLTPNSGPTFYLLLFLSSPPSLYPLSKYSCKNSCLSIDVATTPNHSSGDKERRENSPFLRAAPLFSRSLSFDQIWLYFNDLSRNQDGLNYSFDYSPRRGFGFFNCAFFTLTKLAIAGLSSKCPPSNKNYQCTQYWITVWAYLLCSTILITSATSIKSTSEVNKDSIMILIRYWIWLYYLI